MNTAAGTFLPKPIAAFLLAALLTGCQPQTAGQLQGRYSASYGARDVDLILKPDGTYEQVMSVSRGPGEVISVGSWVYRPDRARLDLTNLRFPPADGCGDQPTCRFDDGTNASLPVERRFFVWSIQLRVEIGRPYVKQD